MKPHAMPGLLLTLFLTSEALAQQTPTPREVADGVVAAAEALLAELDQEQKKQISFPFDDDEQRRNWSNLPEGPVQRRGLRMGDLSEPQRGAVIGLLRATLSERGLQQVVENMNSDEVLKQRSGGQQSNIGRDVFFVSILGTPSKTEPWMWQFGGHHLAINATVVGSRITLSPTLTGGNPIDYTFEGEAVRQLAGEEDTAYALIGSLTEEQLKQAVVGSKYVNLAFGPKADVISPRQEGICAADLTADQQETLVDLIEERVGILNPTHTAAAMERVMETLPQTYFAWFGPTGPDGAASFRVQGPEVIIEYAPQSMGSHATDHIHAMYREPSNDYGARLIDVE